MSGEHGEGDAATPSPLYGIKLVALRDVEIDPPEWLVAYDPDGGDLKIGYPTGQIESSSDVRDALRFSSKDEAMQTWRAQSNRTPFRPDGKANRPLAAFSVEIAEVPDE